MEHSEFSDPRLVALYDALNPFSADTAFYLEAATKLQASTVIDIGCGTGLLACEFARRGNQVVGVEPQRAMLDVARRRPMGQQVRWIEGDATKLGRMNADLAIMSGHVAQVFLDDADWKETLSSIHAALRPGGHLLFESRNPAAKRWMHWTPELTRRAITDRALGRITVWTELLKAADKRVRFAMHYLFEQSGEELISTNTIVFRAQEEISQFLLEAGFSIEKICGSWDGGPADATSPELIFLAART